MMNYIATIDRYKLRGNRFSNIIIFPRMSIIGCIHYSLKNTLNVGQYLSFCILDRSACILIDQDNEITIVWAEMVSIYQFIESY